MVHIANQIEWCSTSFTFLNGVANNICATSSGDGRLLARIP